MFKISTHNIYLIYNQILAISLYNLVNWILQSYEYHISFTS